MFEIDQDISSIKVLLVDDKKENLFSLETLLKDEEEPVEFIQAMSGSEALKVAIKEELALILLDVQMPEMDGFEVANILKSSSKTRNIPIIFVTALNQDSVYALKGYQTGAVDFLFKPLNPSITKAKVKAFIQIYQQQKELKRKNEMLENLSLLVKNSVDLMCILEGGDLLINLPNPAWEECLHYSIDEVENKSFKDIIINNQNQLNSLRNTIKGVVDFECQVKDKEGNLFWYSWTFVKKYGNWYANGRNITNKKIADEKLEHAYAVLEQRVKERTEELSKSNNELKKINVDLDNFIYTASHDLKAPILNMEGLVRVLYSIGITGNKDYDSVVERIKTPL
jgi:CheY-like chemotaxis protein